MAFRRLNIFVTLVVALLVSAYATTGFAIMLTPVVFGSIQDSPPDGLGDTIFTFVPGAIDNLTSPPALVPRATSAIVEYDVSAFASAQIDYVRLDGRIFANNFLDTGERIIDILIFAGDGILSLSDFQVAATSVGMVSYSPPLDDNVAFNLDVTAIVQSLVRAGSDFIGVRFAARNVQAPSQLSSSEPPMLVFVVPEPASLALLGIGLAALEALRRRSRCGMERRND